MRRILSPLVAVIATAGFSPVGFAADLPLREQFAYSAPIEMDGGSAVYRLELPLAVYRESVDAQLRDLRVLNGRGEVVPYALRRPSPEVREEVRPVSLALFPLRGDPAAAVAALSLKFRDGQTQLEIQSATPPAEVSASAYLLHAGDEPMTLEALNLEFAPGVSDFAVNARVEISEDLAEWRIVAARVPLVRLRHGADTFEQNRVSFAPARARFWRIRAEHEDVLPAISAVAGVPVAGVADVERLRANALGRAVAHEAGEYHFDLEAQLPVDRLELELPDVNTAARVEFFARRAEGEPWRSVTRSAVYRLNGPNGELVSQALGIAAQTSRYWRVVVDPGGGGIGNGVPALRVGWLPHSLLFVVRGGGPFELVYGSYGAPSAEVALDSLLPVATLHGAEGLAGNVPRAIAGEPRIAGGPQRLLPPPPVTPWRLWLLWSALCGGVITLGVVAWRLARQMRVG